MKPRLALFDLDHTLLSGDSDVLWCDFLMDRGVLARDVFAARNADMEARYKVGEVDAQAFADFYIGTLAGRAASDWEPLRRDFLAERVLPRIPAAARALVRAHQQAGELVVLTTATNRYLSELTGIDLGFEHIIATEVEEQDGVFTGRARGVLNMRAGKVARLADWLAARGEDLADFDSVAYSDSINDLPLLAAATRAVAVDPDARLRDEATRRGWRVIELAR
jgi:HAD superfamily hydrolase (TIGR01490 family)